MEAPGGDGRPGGAGARGGQGARGVTTTTAVTTATTGTTVDRVHDAWDWHAHRVASLPGDDDRPRQRRLAAEQEQGPEAKVGRQTLVA
eukprot:9068832-Pyramimonas_sp.AAC.1